MISWYSFASSYSKDEAATTLEGLRKFDFLLTAKAPEGLSEHFELIKEFVMFERVVLTKLFPPQIQTKNYIFVMRKREN